MKGKRKTELDKIGRGLFERSALGSESVDKIAGSPDAFRLILKRIKENEHEGAERPGYVSRASYFGSRRIAATSLALVAVSLVSFSLLRTDDVKDVAYEIEVPAVKPETARPATPPGVIESEQPIRRAKYSDTVVENISAIKPHSRPRAKTRDENTPKAEFVSLGLSNSPQQTADGGRVIRVELPAASLFAMGVDVPIENGSGMFKADLIVGPDGVTRAVKLVE